MAPQDDNIDSDIEGAFDRYRRRGATTSQAGIGPQTPGFDDDDDLPQGVVNTTLEDTPTHPDYLVQPQLVVFGKSVKRMKNFLEKTENEFDAFCEVSVEFG